MKTGVVKYYSMDSKYGFIINDEDKRDVFVHLNELKRACINELIKGEEFMTHRVNWNSHKFKYSIAWE